MRRILVASLLGLVVVLEIALFIAMVDDSRESFDPLRPATLLPIVADRLHALRSQAELRVREYIDGSTAAFRERIQHESQTPAPVQ